MVVFGILIIGFGASCRSDSLADSRPSQSIAVAAYRVTPRELYRTLRLSGEVEPRARVQIAARTGGAVDSVYVDEGDRVEPGDVLARLDKAETEAELERARAQLELAKLDYERLRDLRARDIVAEAEYFAARAAWHVASSTEQVWKVRLENSVIAAPRAGLITARYVEPGEAVQTRAPVFELIADDDIRARFRVSEIDAVHIREGETLTATFDAMPDCCFDLTIVRIAPAMRQGDRLLRVDTRIPERAIQDGVRVGFMVRAEARIDRRADVLAVPVAAVARDRAEPYVFVIADDQLYRKEVQLGVERGGYIEVQAGLSANDVVVASNPRELREEQSVRIVRWDSDSEATVDENSPTSRGKT